jgi:hypothetical protein
MKLFSFCQNLTIFNQKDSQSISDKVNSNTLDQLENLKSKILNAIKSSLKSRLIKMLQIYALEY